MLGAGAGGRDGVCSLLLRFWHGKPAVAIRGELLSPCFLQILLLSSKEVTGGDGSYKELVLLNADVASRHWIFLGRRGSEGGREVAVIVAAPPPPPLFPTIGEAPCLCGDTDGDGDGDGEWESRFTQMMLLLQLLLQLLRRPHVRTRICCAKSKRLGIAGLTTLSFLLGIWTSTKTRVRLRSIQDG